MIYEPLYKFSHVLDEFSDDKPQQMKLILIRMGALAELWREAKGAFKEQVYDDIDELNKIYGKLYREIASGSQATYYRGRLCLGN